MSIDPRDLICPGIGAALVGLVAGLRYRSRTSWRNRREVTLRPGHAWCPTCRATGEYVHQVIRSGYQGATLKGTEVGPCPSCHGLGQIPLPPHFYGPPQGGSRR